MNNLATSTSIEVYNSSYGTTTTSMSYDHSHNVNDNVAVLPAPFYSLDSSRRHRRNYQHIKSGFCDLSGMFCSFKGDNQITTKVIPMRLHDWCVLWDKPYSRNTILAIEKFFHFTVALGSNEHPPGVNPFACLK